MTEEKNHELQLQKLATTSSANIDKKTSKLFKRRLNRVINIATVFIQIGLTLLATFILYMLFALFDYQGGVANFIGLALFHPVFAILLSILTIAACGVIGLPIRLSKKINEWWRTHFYLSIFIVIIGIASCTISLTSGFVEETTIIMDGMEMVRTIPNQILSIAGWFFVAFGILHMFPPKKLQDKIVNFFKP